MTRLIEPFCGAAAVALSTVGLDPLLKWPGGKRKLAPAIIEAIGVGAFDSYWLGDINPAVTMFLESLTTELSARAVYNHTAQLVGTYNQLGGDGRERMYYHYRDHYNDKPIPELVWFLNRTCYNGLWRVNSRGAFNVPHGSYKKVKVPKLEEVLATTAFLSGVKITCTDFAELIDQSGAGDVVYCDPPYVPEVEGGFVSYTRDGFDLDDHARLNTVATDAALKGARVFVSNSDTPSARSIYCGGDGVTVEARYLDGSRNISRDGDGRGKKQEVLYEYKYQ